MLYNLKGKLLNVRPYTLDTTLSEAGSAAEAKATGDAIDFLQKMIANLAVENGTLYETLTDCQEKITALEVALASHETMLKETIPSEITRLEDAIAEAVPGNVPEISVAELDNGVALEITTYEYDPDEDCVVCNDYRIPISDNNVSVEVMDSESGTTVNFVDPEGDIQTIRIEG